MTTLANTSITIDPIRWPDVAYIPGSVKAVAAQRVAQSLFFRAVHQLPIRVHLPGGRVIGGAAHDADAPDMTVHQLRPFLRRLGDSGLIGFGESYLAGEWDSSRLADLIAAFAQGVDDLVPAPLKRLRSAYLRRQPSTTRPSTENSRSNVEKHYDLSNDMFATFLDETMTYSSALFDPRATGTPDRAELVAAQHAKIDRMLDEGRVGTDTRVLEIGTGWGELALRAAQRGARVHSITLSSEQLAWARAKAQLAGVADRVNIELADYRTVRDEYDAVLSVEMIEAVGLEFLPTYFETLRSSLRPGGRAVVQAITMPHHRMLETRNTYTWIHKYIFPGGALPSLEILESTAAASGLRTSDALSMGQSYGRTLDAWADRFSAATDRLETLGFDEVFRRMWVFYLRYSEGGFRSGYLDVHQLTYEVA